MRAAKEYGGLTRGMPLGAGHVQEIYPGIDRFSVHIHHGNGECEVQWHSITTDADRLIKRQQARSSSTP